MVVPLASKARRYSAAGVLALAAWLAREMIDPLIGEEMHFITAFPAVAAGVWFGGLGPGILTTALCLAWANLAGDGHILERDLFLSATFAVSSALVIGMGHAMHRERKRSMLAERNLRATTDSLPVLISHIGPDFTYRLNNRAYHDWFGVDLEKLRGRTMEEVLGAEAFAKIEPRLRKALAGERVTFTDYLPYTRNGGRWVRVSYTPLKTVDGSSGIVALVEDITAQHQAEANLAERERDFRAFFELNATGLAETDESGRFLRVNGKFCQMLGHPGEKMLQLSFADITHPDDLPQDRERFEAALQSGAAQWEAEKRFVSKDGAGIWALVRGTILRDEAGQAVRTIASIIDLTERKSIETALQESEKRLRLALDAGKFGTWEWNIERNEVLWSDGVYKMHGLSRAEFDGTVQGFQKLVHPEDLPKVARALEASLKQNRPYQMEFRGAGPNGSTIWVWTAATMLQTPNKPSRMIGIATDITARKRDEELLRSQARHLEELVRARTARLQEVIAELEGFSYTIAHDLRAPLRSMHGFASILREDHGPKLDEKGLEYIDRIAQSAGRMDELIQDVLSYSRVTRDELSLHPMDPAELLDQTIEAHAEMMKPFADLAVRRPMPQVMASRALLAQCFSNLLGNAVKFVAPGAAPVVRVEAEEHGEMVRICVRDNGIGIAPEHRERVFGLFQRLSQEYSGTGIGLAIVKRAAERMHGRAGVESTPGEGSCFWIELKRA